MHDLTALTFRDITEASATVRKMGSGANSMEQVATRIVSYFYQNLGTNREKSCALVRFFKTHPYHDLSQDLQNSARQILGRTTEFDQMKCLTLIATAGTHPDWNSRHNSSEHKAIPLPSHEFVAKAPMISDLVRQFGIELQALVEPSPKMPLDLARKTFKVFHVPEALGSPCVPAQDNFVLPFGIRSVVGFGGALPTGNLFTVILFFKTPISRETADLFGSLALSAKVAVLPFEQSVFQ